MAYVDTSRNPKKDLDPPGIMKLGETGTNQGSVGGKSGVPTFMGRSTLSDIQISALMIPIPGMGLTMRTKQQFVKHLFLFLV